MPPGNVRPKRTVRVIERTTAEVCLEIARRVQQERRLMGDAPGEAAARQVAEVIQEDVLSFQRAGG